MNELIKNLKEDSASGQDGGVGKKGTWNLPQPSQNYN